MYFNTKGLILRETLYKETSKILTVLTSDAGLLTVTAKGARRKGSKLAPSAQLLCFSDMTLSGTQDHWTLTEANTIEQFEGLRFDLERLALGAYFAQILEVVCEEDIPNPALLSLGLHSLYRLSEGKKEIGLIKAAFEFRLMMLAGFMPQADCCVICHKEMPSSPVLGLKEGAVFCQSCLSSEVGPYSCLCESSLLALRYCLSANLNKMFSFSITGEAKKRFEKAAEQYTLSQLDRSFHTLDYYYRIKH